MIFVCVCVGFFPHTHTTYITNKDTHVSTNTHTLSCCHTQTNSHANTLEHMHSHTHSHTHVYKCPCVCARVCRCSGTVRVRSWARTSRVCYLNNPFMCDMEEARVLSVGAGVKTNGYRVHHRLRAYARWLHTCIPQVIWIDPSAGCLNCEHSFPPLAYKAPSLSWSLIETKKQISREIECLLNDDHQKGKMMIMIMKTSGSQVDSPVAEGKRKEGGGRKIRDLHKDT